MKLEELEKIFKKSKARSLEKFMVNFYNKDFYEEHDENFLDDNNLSAEIVCEEREDEECFRLVIEFKSKIIQDSKIIVSIVGYADSYGNGEFDFEYDDYTAYEVEPYQVVVTKWKNK